MDEEREKIRRKIYGKPKGVVHESPQGVDSIEVNFEVNPRLLRMFPPGRIKKLMEKEARRYKAALEKKWRNYLAAVNR